MLKFLRDRQLISKLAYVKWEEAGRPFGFSGKHYTEAENELDDAISKQDTRRLAFLIWRAENGSSEENYRKAEKLIAEDRSAKEKRDTINRRVKSVINAKRNVERTVSELDGLKTNRRTTSGLKIAVTLGAILVPVAAVPLHLAGMGLTAVKVGQTVLQVQKIQELKAHSDTMNVAISALNESLVHDGHGFIDPDVLSSFASEFGLELSDFADHLGDGLHHAGDIISDCLHHVSDFVSHIDLSDFALAADIVF